MRADVPFAKPTAPSPHAQRGRLGIALRIALLCWLVAMVTLLAFVVLTIPQQTKTFLGSLESKANGVAVSLRDVAAGAAVNEDFASVVNAGVTMVNGDAGLDFLIVTKNDGFSLVIEKNGWRVEPAVDAYWLPRARKPEGSITVVPLLDRRVFHYAQPFDYSAIQWGWIHVGLSLKDYDRAVALLYGNTTMLALGCAVFSLLFSVVYAGQLVRPILRLRHVVQQIASGDLSVRADATRHDELGSLAESVNTMTEALLRRDRILESVRYAAQQFMQIPDWEVAIEPVLGKIAQAADVSRAYIFENRTDTRGRLCMALRCEWIARDVNAQPRNPGWQEIPYSEPGFSRWKEALGNHDIVCGLVSGMTAAERAVLEPQQIRSLIVIPVFAEGTWWGFLEFDDCSRDRIWTDAEQDSLRAGADMLGATLARQRIQEALVLAKEAADHANRAKSEFLANMSHELRTPLNHIIGFTEVVLGRSLGDLTPDQDEFLSDVRGSSLHLLSLINDVLDLAKVEAGKMELSLADVRIRDVLENSLMMVKEKALKQSIRLTTDLDGVPEVVRADERMIRQVVYNLLSNAVKFTPGGGEVRLGGRVQDSAEIAERVQGLPASEEWLCISIADTGIGLEPQNLARLFRPFEQAHGSVSRKFQGTGLGLALARRMIERHSGVIWAESDGAGRGSTFRFAIPIVQPLDASRDPPLLHDGQS